MVRLVGWFPWSASRRANPALAKLEAPTVAPAGASPFHENFVGVAYEGIGASR